MPWLYRLTTSRKAEIRSPLEEEILPSFPAPVLLEPPESGVALVADPEIHPVALALEGLAFALVVALPVRQQGLGQEVGAEDGVEGQPGIGVLVRGVRAVIVAFHKVQVIPRAQKMGPEGVALVEPVFDLGQPIVVGGGEVLLFSHQVQHQIQVAPPDRNHPVAPRRAAPRKGPGVHQADPGPHLPLAGRRPDGFDVEHPAAPVAVFGGEAPGQQFHPLDQRHVHDAQRPAVDVLQVERVVQFQSIQQHQHLVVLAAAHCELGRIVIAGHPGQADHGPVDVLAELGDALDLLPGEGLAGRRLLAHDGKTARGDGDLAEGDGFFGQFHHHRGHALGIELHPLKTEGLAADIGGLQDVGSHPQPLEHKAALGIGQGPDPGAGDPDTGPGQGRVIPRLHHLPLDLPGCGGCQARQGQEPDPHQSGAPHLLFALIHDRPFCNYPWGRRRYDICSGAKTPLPVRA